jgi:DNA polymerase I-like protein with 3'-5' exonuclease and polymerase domains
MRDENGVIHPVYNLTGTVTGRLASENPNAQQMPRKAEVPSLFQYQNEVKSLFISKFGKNGCIVNLDYSQLELRIAGVISGDEVLEEVYKSGIDLHIATASKTFGVPVEEVTKDLRTKAKGVGFGIIYGKSGVTFGKELYLKELYEQAGDPKGDGKSLPEKQRRKIQEKATKLGYKIVEDYLNAYPGLSDWLENTKKFADENGYVETMFGRKRRLPDLHSTIPTLRENAIRQSINAPIQGTGSDCTLRSIIEIQDLLINGGYKTRMMCTVHDSIVFDVYMPEFKELVLKFKYIMEHVHEPYIKTEVPLLAEIEAGDSYGSVFEMTAEEVAEIENRDDFYKWLHEQKLNKYKKEVSFFRDKEHYSKDELIAWLEKNERPIDELMETIDEAYKES